MKLKKELRKAGFDLIEGPLRNHKPLQLWRKRGLDAPDLQFECITDVFKSDCKLEIEEDGALAINYQDSNEYKFNIGIAFLEDLLSVIGLGSLDLSAKINQGKKVTLSYNSSKSYIVPSGNVSNFLFDSDLLHPRNQELKTDLNKDNVLVITGVLTAKDIRAVIESDTDISAQTEAELNDIAEGKASFSVVGGNKLEMKSEGNLPFPVAVKAHRINWDKGEFERLELVTDNRIFF